MRRLSITTLLISLFLMLPAVADASSCKPGSAGRGYFDASLTVQLVTTGTGGAAADGVISQLSPKRGGPTEGFNLKRAPIHCGSGFTDCKSGFSYGTLVVLKAVSADDSVFSGWSGCDHELSDGSCVIQIVGTCQVYGIFSDSDND